MKSVEGLRGMKVDRKGKAVKVNLFIEVLMYKHSQQKVQAGVKNEGKVEYTQIQNIANQKQLVDKVKRTQKKHC